MGPETRTRWTVAEAGLLFAGALALYGSTACRTLYFGDSGELIAVASTFGIAHPTGYPLWTLLAGTAARVPIASAVAFRISLLSAALAALAAALLFASLARATRRPAAAALGAGLLATGGAVWGIATVAEVYAAALALLAAAVAVLVAWRATRREGLLFALAGLAGLMPAAHMLLVPVAAAIAIVVLATDPALLRRPGRIAALAGTAVAAAAAGFAYLPIRSAMDPPLDWGHPCTAANLYDVLTQREYRGVIFSGGAPVATRLREVAGAARDAVGIPGAIAAALGAAALVARDRAALAGLAALAAGNVFMVVSYESAEWRSFLFPTYAALAILVAAGAAAALRAVDGRAPARVALAIGLLVAAAPVARAAAAYGAQDLSRHDRARDYALALADSVGFGGILFTRSSNDYFAILYLQHVEGRRPDVVPLFTPNLRMAWYRDEIRRRHPTVSVPADPAAPLERWVAANVGERPVHVTPFEPALAQTLVPNGPAFVATSQPRPLDRATIERSFALLAACDYRGEPDEDTIQRFAKTYFQHGVYYLAREEPDAAARAFRRAAAINPRDPAPLLNLGVIEESARRLPEAERLYRRALEIDPGNLRAQFNLATLVQSVRGRAALPLLERYLAESEGVAAEAERRETAARWAALWRSRK